MRPVALGRRNWIHIGSVQAGPKMAAILSVVDSCVDRNSQLRDYLKHRPSAAFLSPSRAGGASPWPKSKSRRRAGAVSLHQPSATLTHCLPTC
jgi:hypothetical protein